MNGDVCIILGRGPSADLFDWSLMRGSPIVAISSGIYAAPKVPEHWCCVDPQDYFDPALVEASEIQKHITSNQQDSWTITPSVRIWPVVERADMPDDGTVAFYDRVHSLPFGVQVACNLGYRILLFVGVDLQSNDLWPVTDTLKRWYPIAQARGIEWVNASPISSLQEFMPFAPKEGVKLCS